MGSNTYSYAYDPDDEIVLEYAGAGTLGPYRWTFPGDAAAAIVLEWYRINTRRDPNVNLGDHTERNWRLIFGDHYELMAEVVPGKVLDEMYQDLLDAWHIQRRVKMERLHPQAWDAIPAEWLPVFRGYILTIEDRIAELDPDFDPGSITLEGDGSDPPA